MKTLQHKTNTVRIGLLTENEQTNSLSNNSYFRYILQYGKSFCSFLKCKDVTELIRTHGYKAYNYKAFWELKDIPFQKALMLYLLCKIDPFSTTVGRVGDHWVSEDQWVVDMYQKNYIKLAFRFAESQQ